MQHIGLKFLNESYREWINQTGQYKWQHRGLNVDLDRERYIRTDYYDIVRQEFVTRFGSAYLDTVNASLRPEDEVEGQYDSWRFIGYFPRNGWHRPHDWLYRLFFHQPRQYDIPIKHILLMEFIAGNVVNFVNGRNVLTDAASFLQSMQEAAATQGEDS
ncbi:hypothetical protein [Alicyclobacillus sp. SO9]|uniref:hypothetical protein n=1 Tax=Alicyclobacillus sp. SO9 TaxID=2665646 RepID=UPI001E3092B8|nr:hypothetical protein [Alicyclobacillus sp. SO9]